jgi:hypothetical protein
MNLAPSSTVGSFLQAKITAFRLLRGIWQFAAVRGSQNPEKNAYQPFL